MSLKDNYIACETYPGYYEHVRLIGDRPIHKGGHIAPKPLALCGKPVAWDISVPISSVECPYCQGQLAKVGL